ncbi:DUF2480 family protein [Olivibacter sp. CPCC 100613]|uniref:DUF2480 family protein n=1 Tax=Olivibacter sp. CPCC 100613 TaxID=3079931 RepID=UPI002FF7B843
MNTVELLENKIKTLDITAINLLDYRPTVNLRDFDIAPHLYKGLIVREKEFKESIEKVDWLLYKDTAVSLFCAIDAIIPQWVYMFISAKLSPYTSLVSRKHQQEHLIDLWIEQVSRTDFTHLLGKRVVLKANLKVPDAIYITATNILLSYGVKTLMYGELGMPKVVFKQMD